MTKEQFQRFVSILESTGLHFAKGELDKSGNRKRLVDIPWEAALIRIIRDTQWTMTEEDYKEPRILSIVRTDD